MALYTEGNNLCLRAKTDTAGYKNTLGSINGEVNIYLASGFVADGMSLFETPELLFIGTKSPLAVREGNLRVLFMPKNVEDKISRSEEAEPVTVEQGEAVAV